MEQELDYNVKYGDYVRCTDRWETVHIWSKELEDKNNGRFQVYKITKEQYDEEMKQPWNHPKINKE